MTPRLNTHFSGRDHLVRIRQTDCSCTVINLLYQREGTLHELRQGLRAAAARWRRILMVWVSLLVIFVIQPRVASTLVPRRSAMVTLIARPPFSPLFSVLLRLLLMVPSTPYPALIACSSTFRWPSCATSGATPGVLHNIRYSSVPWPKRTRTYMMRTHLFQLLSV